MARILVVDDELDLCEILRFNLESEGYEVETLYSAEDALAWLAQCDTSMQPDLILLDVMLEQMSGFEMAKQLRKEGYEVPIVFLTALNNENELLLGFESGGDDYVTKPFSFQTVLARIRAVLKRSLPKQEKRLASTVTEDGNLRIDRLTDTVFVENEPVALTKKEYGILSLLLEQKGQYLTRETILSKVWGDDVYVGDRSVDVHIARLRKKLGVAGDRIGNRSGYGYFFE